MTVELGTPTVPNFTLSLLTGGWLSLHNGSMGLWGGSNCSRWG
jgi:hypothetical protein